ncbi:hypothetical protein B0T21DRAFT_380389 [Apiosordaria backusii]|uniref:Uncharacterized protein n=1 Tax=Apiosordaria backusii TaxID=314023 RepID=A0AA40EZU2_9PEZI|nr:hypothetical protein B0T21DRAFT_380389 [Apiosordaria backusii]
MAPATKLTNHGGEYLSPRRTIDSNCYGWDCLSDLAQFGVVLVAVFCVGLGWYLWTKLGKSDHKKSRRSSLAANLAALTRHSRSDCRSEHRRSRRSQRISGSIYRRSHSRRTSRSVSREARDRRDSDSSTSPRRPSSQHVEMVDLANDDCQLRGPVIPPPPTPAPVLWTAGPVPIFIPPPAYRPTPSNDSRANEIRFSSAVDYQAPSQLQQVPFHYGPTLMPPFTNGMPPNNYLNGPFLPPNRGIGSQPINGQAGMSHSDAAERSAESRPRSWFPFFKATKRLGGGHARSISESAASSRQPLSPSEFSDLHFPPMRERGRSRQRRMNSIRLIDRSPSPQRQRSTGPYPRIGWRNNSPSVSVSEEDQSEGVHPSELSFQSVGTSMRVHDGQPSSEATSSNVNHDPHFEAFSPERRRRRSLRRDRRVERGSDADDEEDSSPAVSFPHPRRQRQQRPYSTSVLPPMSPSPDIQFPSPESQRVRVEFLDPRREERERDRARERRRRERTPAPGHQERERGRSARDRRANHRSRNTTLLGRLRAFRREMRGEH